MKDSALASMPVNFRLRQAGLEVEVHPLWLVLATLSKHGFRTYAPKVRTGLAGQFLLTIAVYKGARDNIGAAMRAVRAELGYDSEQFAAELLVA